jgi:hypothetical protein
MEAGFGRSIKKGKGGFTHIFVALDKFTKWSKVKPTTSITGPRRWNSSKKSCIGLAFPITLSLIMGLDSL